MDMSTVVRFVDDWRNRCPGTVNNHKLIPIANQIERRRFGRGRTKHIIFQEDKTRNLWYKNSMCNAGIVAMGFSLSRLANHPNAIPMELYAKYFLDRTNTEWLKRNDFELIEQSKICKAKIDNGEIKFESTLSEGATLQEIIEDDKHYGTMKPRNGKYFTYKAFDWQGQWINHEQIEKALTLTWNKIEKILDIEFREAKEGETPDFSVHFRSTADDDQMESNTLQYHYYPISDFDHPLRGMCVVNTDFIWTINGEPIPLHLHDPIHYPEPTDSTVKTYDFDAVYEHEGPGHGLGLPHSPTRNTKMFWSYQGMVETIFDETPYETIPRLQAKYPKRDLKPHILQRWINYFRYRQDNL